MALPIDITGERYGRLVAVGFDSMAGWQRNWLFRCDCGSDKVAPIAQVRFGKIKSCGCQLAENRSAFGKMNLRHGMSGTPTYKSWLHMVSRCTNKGRDQLWKYYGGRGIKVCDRWMTFDNFLADMGVRPDGTTIDRIDGNGHYEPGNCRWATFVEQCNNRRTNRVVTFRDQKMTLAELASLSGVRLQTLWFRLQSGWTVEEAATLPVLRGSNQFTTPRL